MTRTRFRYAATAVALAATVFALAGCSRDQTATGTASSTAISPAAATSPSVAASATTDSGAVVGWQRGKGPNPYQFLPKVPSFRLTSETVRNGKPLPIDQFSGVFGVPGGKDISPQLSWSGFPKATKSFVVSMYDPEAPTMSGFWHWIVADLPASTKSLPANAGALNSTKLPDGAFQLNGDAGAARFIGAAPPPKSGIHEYYITVTALDVSTTGLKSATSGALLHFTIGGHTLARATIVCPTPSS
jgi:Raf kinase inhibitor-like YbhB/YbcL family protein